jgi:hypothetical protein
LLAALALAAATSLAPHASAEPYLAVQQGYKCVTCHVNPTGGGLRNGFGTVFTENVLPEWTLPAGFPAWRGDVLKFLRVGADYRTARIDTDIPNQPMERQDGLEQLRAYGDLTIIPRWLDYYVDETMAPGKAFAEEYYAKLTSPDQQVYFKAGQFYLPFGWRLQDQTAFAREVTGISMTTPDKGFELGMELPSWSAQLDYTRGEANVAVGTGHQWTGQVVYVQPTWRAGLSGATERSVLGNRVVAGAFAGLRTGPVAWLGEFDFVHDLGFPGGRRMEVLLGEADWALLKGHNLKVTGEMYDPDRTVANDQQARWSFLYEWTPIPFVQLRTGWRRYRGIPQNDLDNRRVLFIELHAFL